jgi:hypothetical protein
MSLPSEKHPSSPATGRAPRPGEGDDVSLDEDADLTIGDEVFQRPGITIPPKPQNRDAPKGVFSDLNPPPPEVKEVEAKKKKKNPLEKRNAAPLNEFKRVIRPQTAMTASAAADLAKSESPAPLDSVDSLEFGKVHNTAVNPDFRRNKLHTVLDSAYKHSGLGWLEWVDRIGPRAIIGVALLLVTGGFVAWRFFGAFGGGPSVIAVEEEQKGPSAEERIARGTAAVKALLAAQTIPARLPLVMDPDRTAPRMKDYYEFMQGQDPKITAWEVGAPVGSRNGDWLPFTFTDAAGRKVTVVMGETESGCIVDWENFTAFGDLPWAEFCRTKPSIPKSLRVRLRRSEKYTGKYSKDDWQSYEVEHRTGPPVLLAYAPRAGRFFQALDELIQGEAWQCALLYLRFDPGTGDLIVEDVIRTRWQDEATSWTGP